MLNDKFPNPLPAGLGQNLKTLPPGTVVFVPDEKGTDTLWKRNEKFAKYDITSPVHFIDEGMVRHVCYAIDRLRMEKSMIADWLERAFAHVLVPPQNTGKDAPKTCRERMDHFITDTEPTIKELVRCVYAQADAIDALRAEVEEGRNG